MSEVEVALPVPLGASGTRELLEVIYAGGLRVSKTIARTWADVLPREDRVQLSILGKGIKVRQVLLPTDVVSRSLLSQRSDAGANESRLRQPQRRPPDRACREQHGQAHGRKAGMPWPGSKAIAIAGLDQIQPAYGETPFS